MQQVPNPLVTMYQTQLEASRRFADAVFSGTEKIDRLVIEATHRVVTEQLDFARSITALRDPREVGAALQSGMASHTAGNAMNDQKEIMRVFAEMQNEIGRSMQEYIQQVGSYTAASPLMPGRQQLRDTSDAAYNPVTGMFSVWESAFKEVADLARTNMMTARSTAEAAVNRTMESAGNYAHATVAGDVDSSAHQAKGTTPHGDDKKGSSSHGKKK